jgi:hypothetical protein
VEQTAAAGPDDPPPGPPSRVRRLGAALFAYGVQIIFFALWLSMA